MITDSEIMGAIHQSMATGTLHATLVAQEAIDIMDDAMQGMDEKDYADTAARVYVLADQEVSRGF